jgi:hypothetical protein
MLLLTDVARHGLGVIKKITGVEINRCQRVKKNITNEITWKCRQASHKNIEGRGFDTRLGHWDFSLT